MLSRLASIPRRAPLTFSIAYGGGKTIAADVFVQKYVEGREEVDQRRACVFLGFGLFQVGFVQYMIYSKLFPFIFKGAGTFSTQTLSQMASDTRGLKNVLKQVAVDMLVYHPLCYFPVFYTCQELVNGNVQDPSKTIHDALQKYMPNAVDDWMGLWKIFIPVSLFQNSFCPVHLRVPCVATAGFFYCIILSMTRGDEVNNAAQAAQKMKEMPDEDFESCILAIRGRYWGSKQGVDLGELTEIMAELGLRDASVPLFQSLDNSDGLYPRGSGVVDAVRLVDGLKLLAGRCAPEERVKFISANPDFVPKRIPSRIRSGISSLSDKEFEECISSIRQRQLDSKDGVGREEFAQIMGELGLGEASSEIFETLDNADGLYPRGSGVVDAVRLVDGLKLLAGRCAPDERVQFLHANPSFVPEKVPSRMRTGMSRLTDEELEQVIKSIRSRQWTAKDGVGRREFIVIMEELGLAEAAIPLFEALDDSDGLYPRGSGIIDLERFIQGMKLLSGRCPPEERVQFISENPSFLPEKVAPRRTFSKQCYYK